MADSGTTEENETRSYKDPEDIDPLTAEKWQEKVEQVESEANKAGLDHEQLHDVKENFSELEGPIREIWQEALSKIDRFYPLDRNGFHERFDMVFDAASEVQMHSDDILLLLVSKMFIEETLDVSPEDARWLASEALGDDGSGNPLATILGAGI